MEMPFRFLALAAILAGLTCASLACSDGRTAPDPEPTTFIQDDVLVSFRKTRTSAFQETTLTWSGSVRNLGNRVPNARFEVLSTRGPVFNGALQTKIEATQAFGDLLPGQEQLLILRFSFPNSHALAISTRLVHD